MSNDTNTNNPVSQKGNPVPTTLLRIKQLNKMNKHPDESVKSKAKKELESVAYGNDPYGRNDIMIVNAARMALHGDLEAALTPSRPKA